jgi:two-component sensor histidine kinase/ActR/RegA family two-component response regulator
MVDDSAADRKLYRMLLEDRQANTHSDTQGLEVLEAGGAPEGLDLCRSAAPDCVLLDYKLPGMTGLEFLAHLTGDSPSDFPSVAVVMLTNFASERMAVEALRAGAQDYLSKDRITAESQSMAVEKATQKVALLRALKDERDRLARSLAQKDVLLQEVHHRVKNNLAVIVSLLRLQAGAFADARLSAALRESQNRVESMALIHEQLYHTSDQAGDRDAGNLNSIPREVDLAQHVSQLAANLFHSYGVRESRVALLVAIAPLPLAVDRAIPAGLILNELISNALKHAFPEGRSGAIAITGKAAGGRIILEVHDDGVGLDPAVDVQHAVSPGLRIVKILTRQLKGDFEAGGAGDDHSGAVFRVSFPAA